MGKTVTTEEWVARAKARWGDHFDYSRAVWVNRKTRITVGCPIHGWIEVSPETHLHNRVGSTGCPRCGKQQAGAKRRLADWEERQNRPRQKTRLTEEDFKQRFQARWGDQFQLVEGSFSTTAAPVDFTCRTHDEKLTFSKAGNLLAKGKIWPCPRCKVDEKTQDFIDKARALHGDAYDYSKSIWSPEHLGKSIIVICPKHGEWPSGMYHIKTSGQKAGCPKCASELQGRKAAEAAGRSFKEKARKKHGDLYLYEKVEYINNRVPVDIYCKAHDAFFSQSPNSHLNGHGCPDCAIEKSRQDRIPSLEGMTFGELTVIRLDHTRPRRDRSSLTSEYVPVNKYWLCKCSCGKETVVFQTSLTSGGTKSCGCSKFDNLLNAELSALYDSKIAAIDTELYLVEVGRTFEKFGITIQSAETRGGLDYTRIYWRYRDRRDVVVPVEAVLHELTKRYFDIDRIANEGFDHWGGWTELRFGLDIGFWIGKAEQLLTECSEIGHEKFLSHYFDS
jgi:hypothetical protein